MMGRLLLSTAATLVLTVAMQASPAWAEASTENVPAGFRGATGSITAPERAVIAPLPALEPVPDEAPRRRREPSTAGAPCANPNALGVSRVVEIDTSGGPGYGFQQYKVNDFLAEGEVVLTFDDGPMPAYTNAVLKALEAHCTKGTFFIVGRMALAFPETVRDTAARGHTIANHTWSHANLGPRRAVPKRAPAQMVAVPQGASGPAPGSSAGVFTIFGGPSAGRQAPPAALAAAGSDQPTLLPPMSPDKAKQEIELGFSATTRALGQPMAPFFRFPYLGHSTAMLNYLGTRNVAVFSIDVDALDYRAKKGEEVTRKVMSDLAHFKKGILLFHDIQPSTAQALPTVLERLKAGGYKVVHIKPKGTLATIASYDAMAAKEDGRRSAQAEARPLAKRTMTWGMASGASASGTVPASAAEPVARKPAKPKVRAEAPASPFEPYPPGVREVLPWETAPRRGY